MLFPVDCISYDIWAYMKGATSKKARLIQAEYNFGLSEQRRKELDIRISKANDALKDKKVELSTIGTYANNWYRLFNYLAQSPDATRVLSAYEDFAADNNTIIEEPYFTVTTPNKKDSLTVEFISNNQRVTVKFEKVDKPPVTPSNTSCAYTAFFHPAASVFPDESSKIVVPASVTAMTIYIKEDDR